MILNSQNPDADLSKKNVATYFHVVREAVAAGIISPYCLKDKYKMSDIMTKQTFHTDFKNHCDHILWRTDFHVHSHNRLEDNTTTK